MGSAYKQLLDLSVPTSAHSTMWQRAFVLLPLAAIAPGLVGDLRLKAVQGRKIAVFKDVLGPLTNRYGRKQLFNL